ncbi:HEAT repeat domain-containing protein [Nodularia spumigena]|uniref:hypothetical protein n=1 Tax=Nodularia spumigena TaxID=70799 RepID=UPI002B1F19B9|nr:hypothetical protein [Nodularia spumigena]MEA5614535.1 hypothetical protein [Nodularia spumigena UHCC 0040]
MLLVSLILILLNPPVWLLVAGWRVLPAPLIASEDFELAWSLRSQLTDPERFDIDQRIAFADYLLHGMYEDEAARWDKRRGMLLNTSIGSGSFFEGVRDARADLGVRHASLLDALGCDIVEAAADATNGTLYDLRSQRPDPLNNVFDHPYFMLRYLVDHETLRSNGIETNVGLTDGYLLISNRASWMPQTRKRGAASLFLFDRFRDGLLFDVATDSGFAGQHAMSFFPADGQWQDRIEFLDRAAGLSVILGTQSPIAPEIEDQLIAWAESTQSPKMGFSLYVFAMWCGHGPTGSLPTKASRENFMVASLRALQSDSVLYTQDGETYTVRQAAQFAIVRIDQSGTRSVPLLRSWLLDDGEFPLHARYDHPDANPALIAAWAEHLSDLAWSDDIEIRRWLARGLPIRTGTPSDARIDEVIARLLIDEDEDIRWDAEYAAELRREAVGNP